MESHALKIYVTFCSRDCEKAIIECKKLIDSISMRRSSHVLLGTQLEYKTDSLLVNLLPLAHRATLISGLLVGDELSLLIINGLLARVEIRLMWQGTLALHEELVSEDHDDEQWNTEVASNDVAPVDHALVSGWNKVVESLEEGNQAAEEESSNGSGGTEWCNVGQSSIWNALCFASADEEDVRDENGDPGQDTENRNQVDEVGKDLLGCGADIHIGQQTESRG